MKMRMIPCQVFEYKHVFYREGRVRGLCYDTKVMCFIHMHTQ